MSWIAKEIKQKILSSIKDDGIAVSKLSLEYGVSKVAIYGWMKDEWSTERGSGFNLRELSRLKKDKEDLLLIIWELTAEINKSKKKSQK